MSEWREVYLKEVCDIYDGPHATPPKLDSGLIFLGISSLGFNGRIDPIHFEYVSEEHYKKWTRRIEPRYQDIVFSYETKLGVAAIIPKGFRCCLGRRMGLLRPKDNIDPRFLLYVYLAPEFQKTIHERTYHGSTVNRIPLKEMPNFPISIPSLPEQKAIAAVLSSLDDKIDLLHRQNKTLEAMAETLFRQWFIEEAQADWELVNLGDLFDISSGKSLQRNQFHDAGSIPVLGANGEIGWTNNYLFKEKLIFTGRVGTLGNIFLVNGEKVWLSDNTLIFRNIRWFYFAYFTLKLAHLEDFNVGSTQPLIRQSDIKEIPISIPNGEKIDVFEESVKQFFDKVEANKNQISTLEKLRDTLLPKLMSGEVRVAV